MPLRRAFRSILVALALLLAAAWPTTVGAQPFPTGFTVTNPAFLEYYRLRGGWRAFGAPISREFVLYGRRSQLFQRALLQIGPDGAVQRANLLDDALSGVRQAGGLTLPPADRALQAAAPRPGSPIYAAEVVDLLHRTVPDVYEGEPVNFLSTFLNTVTLDAAFPNGGGSPELLPLLGLEIWGLPTSAPARDPSNPAFVYQRFQRGIMHYQRDKGVTEGLLVGEWFKSLLTGQDLPPDLAAALAGSLYLGQVSPETAVGPTRPHALPAAGFDGAFVPTAATDARFGVVVAGDPQHLTPLAISRALDLLGAGSWYGFGPADGPVDGRVLLLRPGDDLAQLPELVRRNPSTAWLIGNEPNVIGQDDLSPSAYADFLHRVAAIIKEADPTAKLVGPNVLNWDSTCSACPGFPSGRDWSERFVETYRVSYGALPLDAWGMHAYSLDWTRLPLVDAAAGRQQVEAARAWLDGHGLALPIWLTEFGVIWGYEGIEWAQRADGSHVAVPRGQRRLDLMEGYLDTMLAWLVASPQTAGVERWFLYATAPFPEPYATEAAGISLLTESGTTLTSLGQRYRAWATGQRPASPAAAGR